MLVRIGRTLGADERSKLLSVSLQGGIEFEVEISGLPWVNGLHLVSERDARRIEECRRKLDRFYSRIANVNCIDTSNLPLARPKMPLLRMGGSFI